jgi:hypothetical protein
MGERRENMLRISVVSFFLFANALCPSSYKNRSNFVQGFLPPLEHESFYLFSRSY